MAQDLRSFLATLGFDARRPVGAGSEGFVRARIPGYDNIRFEDYVARS